LFLNFILFCYFIYSDFFLLLLLLPSSFFHFIIKLNSTVTDLDSLKDGNLLNDNVKKLLLLFSFLIAKVNLITHFSNT